MRLKAGIIAIGNEVTDGQIINTNTSWLAQNAVLAGLDVVVHIAVPDECDIILWALNSAESKCDVIFVTGGLGPTRDDLTRLVIARWLGVELKFNETAFSEVEEKLRARNVPVREGHRQQCLFPQGAQLWTNGRGTAHGFSVQKIGSSQNTKLFSLPGPPLEILSVWNNGLREHVETLVPQDSRRKLWTWSTLGLGESEVAHRVESVLQNVPEIEIGYRLHAPYVETKVWANATDFGRLQESFAQMESVLGEYLVLRPGEDVLELFIAALLRRHEKFKQTNSSLKDVRMLIKDQLSNGLLCERLRSVLEDKPLRIKIWANLNDSGGLDNNLTFESRDFDFVLGLGGLQTDNYFELTLQDRAGLDSELIHEPVLKDGAASERVRRIAMERAILHFTRVLNES